MTSLVNRIKSNAGGRNKSAVMTMVLIGESVIKLEEDGDWTCLAWLVSLAEGADKGRVKRVIESVCGVKFKVDKKQPTGLKAIVPDRGSNMGAERLALLMGYINAGVGFRSLQLSKGTANLSPLISGTGVVEFDLAKRCAALVAACGKAGFDMAEIGDEVRYALKAM